jgi:hypothetical protein
MPGSVASGTHCATAPFTRHSLFAVCPQTQRIKPIAPVRTYDVTGVCSVLKSRDQGAQRTTILLQVGSREPIKNLKQPDTKKRTMAILQWTACLNSMRLASSYLGTFFFERAARTRQGIMRMLTGYKEIPKKTLSRQTTVLDFK